MLEQKQTDFVVSTQHTGNMKRSNKIIDISKFASYEESDNLNFRPAVGSNKRGPNLGVARSLHVPKQANEKNKLDWLFDDDNETPRCEEGIDKTTNAYSGIKREDTNLTDTL